MAKIGAPLSPGVARSPSPGPTGKAEPAAAPQPQPKPDVAPQHAAPEAAPISNQAQQVAQQFGSAFASAGRLATQLVKGLVTGANPQQQQQRAEKRQTEREEEGKSAPQSQEAEPPPGEAGRKNPLMAAFSALKRSRLFRFHKTRKRRAGRSEVVSVIVHGDDYDEEEQDQHRARAWLGHDQEDTTFDQARREALLLQQLERQGESPSRIARQLNLQLGMRADRDFKHLLSDEVRPQMDAMAGHVDQIASEERRVLAAMVSRAAYQVGIRNAANFENLLHAAGVAEAAQLAASFEPVVARAAQLERALRRAASPAYRAGLIEAGRTFLETLAGEMTGLAPQEQHLAWGSLLRSAETVEPDSRSLMAHAIVTGVLGDKRSGKTGLIAEALGPALRTAPEGGSWAVQLMLVLSARGEAKPAEQVAEVLWELMREVRGGCIQSFQNLHAARSQPSGGTGEKEALRELDARAGPLAALMPACAQVFEMANAIPPSAAALIDEALLCLASLDVVGATAPGQQLLRRALLAQERGSQTFLAALPRVATTLAAPQWAPAIVEGGLLPETYRQGGQLFLEHVSTQTAQALIGPVLARSQKGDAPSARVLLRSAVRNNAALFGLKSEGARLAADVLENLRDKPGPVSLKRAQVLLQKIRFQHAASKQASRVETLQGLARALAERGQPLMSQPAPEQSRREPVRLTALEIAIDQSAHARKKAPAPAAAPKPESPAKGAPRKTK